MAWPRLSFALLGVIPLFACTHVAREDPPPPPRSLHLAPSVALEGDDIMLQVMLNSYDFKPWREDQCSLELSVVHEGPGRLAVQVAGERRPCRLWDGAPEMTLYRSLGAFPVGRYTIRMGDMEGTFTVLPASTEVGSLAARTRVGMAVRMALKPRLCVQRWARICTSSLGIRMNKPQLHHQMVRAFPDATESERFDAYIDSGWMKLEETGNGDFTYAFASFTDDCDKAREWVSGTAHLTDTGKVEVGPPLRKPMPDLSDEPTEQP